jgi:Tol biopolymer transport system component
VLVSGCSWFEESASDEILFVRETAKGSAIYLTSHDGDEVRRLVEGTSPRWSPDGSRFAYVVDDDEKTRYAGTSLWVMDSDTGARRRVANAESGVLIFSLAWAPDGVRLAYSALSQVVVVNTETGASEVVSLDVGLEGPMDWSRDGRELVVSDHFSSKLLDTGTGAERDIVRTPLTGDGRWSPDGRRIALARLTPFSSRGRLKRFLVLARGDGGNPERITAGAFDSEPAWSPDGGRIYFSRGPAFEGETSGRKPELYVIDLETRSLRQLTRNNVFDRSPDVRPEDRSLPAVPEPAVGDIVVPDLVGRHVLLDNEKRRFRGLGLTLKAVDFLAKDGVLTVVRDQVPRGGSRALRGSVVKLSGSDLGFLYSVGVFSAPIWRAQPGCARYPEPRVQMYGDLVRRVLRKGMSRGRVIALLGHPERSARRWSDWALGRATYSHAEPIDCISLRVEFDHEGRARRFHQSVR